MAERPKLDLEPQVAVDEIYEELDKAGLVVKRALREVIRANLDFFPLVKAFPNRDTWDGGNGPSLTLRVIEFRTDKHYLLVEDGILRKTYSPGPVVDMREEIAPKEYLSVVNSALMWVEHYKNSATEGKDPQVLTI